jgi:membrane fusion protein, adhesin transport system
MNATALPSGATPGPASAAKPVSPALALLAAHFDSRIGLERRLRRPRALVYATGTLLLALGVWAAVAPIDRVVHTQGRVVPSSKQQLVQHLEGGIVSKVAVREGDVVTAGQVLMSVSDLLVNSTLGEKNARLDGLLARAARLEAEASGAERFTPGAALASAGDEVKHQMQAFDARMVKLQQTLQIIEEQQTQKRQEATEQEARRKGLTAELDLARQQLALVTGLLAKDAASQLEALEARSRVERLQTQLRETESSLPRLQAAAQELQHRSAEVVAQFRSEARTALADTRVELQRLQKELGADSDRLRRTDITAPVAGTVNKLFYNTVGGVVKPGDTLMEITPSDAALVLETRVSPAERGALELQQKAIVKVAAFDYTMFGTLAGRITEISPDSLPDERGERYFRVAISVDPDSVRQYGQALTPGMTVTADAVTGQRTVLQYLLSPIRGMATSALRDTK